MFDNIDAARQRDGEKAENRDSEIDGILEPREKVGYENELPLLDITYEEYPSHSDLLKPEYYSLLSDLASHELINSVEQMADELSTQPDTIRKALDLHGIEPPNDNIEVKNDRLTEIIGYVPDEFKKPDNSILIATLYVEKGLSVEEIASILERSTEIRSVRSRYIRQTLIDCYILDGQTTDQQNKRTDFVVG